MSDEDHVSIGDVLERLRDEYPDITVSKIRFLESQGLIDPERTPSGYRKFYAEDIDRLRWVLRQQKDNFLPLKVIKERLDEIDRSGGLGSAGADGEQRGEGRNAGDESPKPISLDVSGVSLTRSELSAASGLDDEALAELEEYGLLRPAISTRDRVLFDEDALAVARAAHAFIDLGVEARHLRMYRAMAEREADLFSQLLLVYRNRRNPEATAEAERRMGELAELGASMRAALLREALRKAR